MTTRFRSIGLCAAGLVASAASALAVADVQSSSPTGFTIRFEVPIAASPTDVHARFLEIGRWWSDSHTYSGKASNLTIRNEPGGCFCEALAGGGFVKHAELVYSDKGKLARFSGGLGPLQELGASGILSFDFSAADKPAATKLVVTYVVGGYPTSEKGLAQMAQPVEAVMKEQVERLKKYVETGKAGG